MVDANRGVPVVLAGLVAHFANVQLCGSVWACPVCGPRIREVRAAEIEFGVARHLGGGGGAAFLTATARHHQGQELAQLFDTIATGYSDVLGSKGWRQDRDEYGITGTIRAAEITHGPNGWHPHIHALLLTAAPISSAECWALGDRWYPRWSRVLVRAGYDEPTRAHGVHIAPVRSAADVASYTAKFTDGDQLRSVGRELTRHDLKQARRQEHRAPLTILRDFAETGDVEDRALWNEYERATFRRRSLTWSRGLKRSLGVGEVSDDEIVGEEILGEVLDVLNRLEWGYVVSKQLQAFLLDMAEKPERRSFDALMAVIRQEVAGAVA